MKRFFGLGLVATLMFAGMNMSSGSDLEVGDDAPPFELTGSDGKVYKLSDFRDTKAVVVAWFPKAFTGGCTKECLSFRENGQAIKEFNVAYFTASCDSVEKNTAFAKSLELDYPILSDPGKEVAKAYGVVHENREVPERWTFIIGADGKLKSIDRKVQAGDHGKDIAAKLSELKIPKKD